MIMMDPLDDWFPYKSYRPHQREMLDLAARGARDGGIVMIDAPTGSGKSSVVSALLAGRNGRKILIAVRTVSQLNTFIRELSLIREKQPGLKSAYLVGKGNMCPLGGEGDVYRRCEGVRAYSTTLMRDRAEKGSLVPSKDPVVLQQIRRMDRDHPLICPYFISSRVFVQAEVAGLKMIPSGVLRTKAERISSESIPPHQLTRYCGECCPYEAMLHAAQNADAVVLNYYHLFDDQIREQLYLSLGIEPQDVILLIDEAHNCGDTMQAVQSVSLEERLLESASFELAHLKQNMKGAEAVRHVLPRITDFMRGLKNSDETEDWFDPGIFDRMIVKGSLYRSMDEIVEELMGISDRLREKNIQKGEYHESAIERLTLFLFRIAQSSTDKAYLTVFRKEEGEVTLEVRNIDPGGRMQDLAGSHHACIMISGTLSPVESYRRYYFGDMPVSTCTLPNVFPRENRRILCADDITTVFSMRQDRENNARITSYITSFATLPGNLAVYFPSYQFLETFEGLCARGLKRRRLFVEPRDAKEAGSALKEFLSLPVSGDSGVLFAVAGGKWSEGLDYRGEMLAGAMVIGLPLAPYNRVRRMVIDYFRQKFGDEGEFISYTLPAINRALQALGRVLRTPEDRGILVIGERRFLEPRVRAGLPGWMREEIVECEVASFGEEVRRWR